MASKVTGIGYTVNRYMDNGYEHLEIEVVQLGNVYDSRLCSFTWQSDNDARQWYGCELKVESQYWDRFMESSKIAGKIAKIDDYGMHFGTQPEEIIDRMESMGIYQATYDARTHGHVLLSECLPAEINDYAEDYTRCGFPNRQAGCLASSVDEARKLIRQELAGMSAEKVQAFINAGEPLKVISEGSRVDRTPWQEVVISQFVTANLERDSAT